MTRLRVLHLGFEDPARPGAGGGSRRTHEVNRRLAADGFEVTVLCAAHPGAQVHRRDGVLYRPLGARLLGRPAVHPFLAQLGYFVLVVTTLWWQVRRHRPDVVVEDFAAPFSSVAVPRLTRVPVVGVVQWLFAEQKARQYRLPFDRVERVGLASHRHLVAVSEDLAGQLRERNPSAEVTALPNGVEERTAGGAGVIDAPARSALVYLGRLEIEQKGIDLLLAAYAAVADRVSSDLWLAGDGPDATRVRELAAHHGVSGRVHLIGAVPGPRRLDLLAQARLVLVPSRYETFGMVAAEALVGGDAGAGLRHRVPGRAGGPRRRPGGGALRRRRLRQRTGVAGAGPGHLPTPRGRRAGGGRPPRLGPDRRGPAGDLPQRRGRARMMCPAGVPG